MLTAGYAHLSSRGSYRTATLFVCSRPFGEHKTTPFVLPDIRKHALHALRSCTGGKTEDFMAAAKLFHSAGQQVTVPTYLVPATQKVLLLS